MIRNLLVPGVSDERPWERGQSWKKRDPGKEIGLVMGNYELCNMPCFLQFTAKTAESFTRILSLSSFGQRVDDQTLGVEFSHLRFERLRLHFCQRSQKKLPKLR